METANLAGRAGHWSSAHWKLAAFGWIAFAVLAVVVGSAVGAKQMKSWAIANGESRRAEQILDQGNFKIPARESVLVQSRTATLGEPHHGATKESHERSHLGEVHDALILAPESSRSPFNASSTNAD